MQSPTRVRIKVLIDSDMICGIWTQCYFMGMPLQ